MCLHSNRNISMPQSVGVNNEIVRCDWVTKDPLYIQYHDSEWGEPIYDNNLLFEMLCLEGQQAGLSWITILKKRENYKQSFHNFNPNKISKMSETAVLKLLNDPGIVRHKGKLTAIKHNSDRYLAMENNGEDFSNFIWSFVGHKPIINNWENVKEVPTETDISKALSKALKKRGFKFVGSTTCYAFMQACGLVNDHIVSCYCRNRDNNLFN